MFQPIHNEIEVDLDKKFVLSDFEGQTISNLALLIQNGNHEASEELYMRFNPFINEMATALSVKYRKLDDDVSLYYECIYNSIEFAVMNYLPEKGNFFHFWRTVMKWEKRKTITYLSKNKNPNKQNTIYEGDHDSGDFFDFFNEKNVANEEYTSFNKMYDDDNAKKILSFIRHHYGILDCVIMDLWMNSYTLREIAVIIDKSFRFVVSKIYSLQDSIRDAIKKGFLIVTI